jgi:N-acyl-D-amino-acid deacylase
VPGAVVVVMLDLLLTGGRIIDGAGNPWFEGNVGVRDDRIVHVGAGVPDEGAARRIDVSGLFVCPGFIDMHTHSDLQLLVHPRHEAKVFQGVTLDVLGQDGLSYAPVDGDALAYLRGQLAGWNDDPADFDWNWRSISEYLARFDDGVAINVAYLVPHGTVRMMAMGLDDRPPTPAELATMRRLVADGIREGAVGLSAGLTYAPGMFADDAELIALCSVFADTGAFYCPHHRSYGVDALQAYADAIEVARAARVPIHLAHAHLGFEINKGRAPELLTLIDAARASGVDVTLDTYPYLAGNTYLHSILPGWVHTGGPGRTLAILADAAQRERLRAEVEDAGSDGFHGVPIDWELLVISSVRREHNRHLTGTSVGAAAAAAGARPIDFVCDLLIDEELGVASLLLMGNEDNVRTIMAHPVHMAGSDGILVGARPHPRGFGTFPRYLARYARELGVLTPEQAVRKMTSLPAQRLGLFDRGLVRPGMAADLVCFDLERIQDRATYEQPTRRPEGLPYVIVNGTLVVDEGEHTGALPGRALRSSHAAAAVLPPAA